MRHRRGRVPAHAASGVVSTDKATTEQLRQAIVHYRTLIAELIGGEPLQLAGDPANPAPSHP